MSVAIHCEGVGKRYRLGERERYRALRDVITDALRSPLRRLRQSAAATDRGHDEIWALRDIDLEIQQGEIVGMIGRNGAGKSTLLKVLSRITEPTEGRIRIRGRVGSLLEVGTGFHPELTGRENIYLNGAVLGMRRAEIARKFDEIVAFAEVERFLDTPVKHYSSGMYVRLAFAVAAHLEPEILLVDEVLAVGDAAFQKKCLGKMGDVATDGRTVVFVSHNMAAITKFVPTCVLLDEGRIVERGATAAIVSRYLSSAFPDSGHIEYGEDASKEAQIVMLAVRSGGGEISGVVDPSDPLILEVEFVVRVPKRDLYVAFMIDLPDGTAVCHSTTLDAEDMPMSWLPGRHRVRMTLAGGLLNCGTYTARAGLARHDGIILDYHGTDGVVFELTDASEIGASGVGAGRSAGVLAVRPQYRVMGVESEVLL